MVINACRLAVEQITCIERCPVHLALTICDFASKDAQFFTLTCAKQCPDKSKTHAKYRGHDPRVGWVGKRMNQNLNISDVRPK